jgi:hypothetical protein
MDRIGILLFAALVQVPSASPTQPSIDFYFTSDAVLERGGAAAMTEWTAQCLAGGEFAEFARAYAPDPRMGTDERKAQAAKLDRSELVRIATDAWRRANTALPQGPMRVCVDVANAGDTFTRERMGGVAGVTAGHGRIILRIHPDADWQAALPYALAHEMHHSYWVGHHFDSAKPFTLADYLVLEGRADYFAGTLFAFRAPWTTALDAAAYATAWRALSMELNTTEWPTLQAAMFGSPQAGIPAWAGYSIGYRLVSERMARAPKLDMKAMTAAPASEFIPPSRSR